VRQRTATNLPICPGRYAGNGAGHPAWCVHC